MHVIGDIFARAREATEVAIGARGPSNESGISLGKGSALTLVGTGDPENHVEAPVGSLWLRDDGGAGTTLYVKETGSGNTGWVAK